MNQRMNESRNQSVQYLFDEKEEEKEKKKREIDEKILFSSTPRSFFFPQTDITGSFVVGSTSLSNLWEHLILHQQLLLLIQFFYVTLTFELNRNS